MPRPRPWPGRPVFDVPLEDVNWAFVRAARKNGLFVSVFTVHEPAELQKMLEAKVDYIETNYPAQMRARMGPRKLKRRRRTKKKKR